MATFSGLSPKASSHVALRAAVDFGKLLAIVRSLAPAASDAALVARWTLPLRVGEIVLVDVLTLRPSDDFRPIDSFDMTKVVVVHNSNAPR